MRILGMRLPPPAMDLPLNISFPLHRRPGLDVTVWGRGVPDAARGPVLAIRAVNVAGAPVEIMGVHAGSIHTSLPMEAFYGGMTAKLPLHELKGERQPPCVLQAGESALWTANLRQLADELVGRHDIRSNSVDIGNPTLRGRLAVGVHNRVAMVGRGRMAVVVEDGRGGLHKAKVRWQPPAWAMLGRRRFPSTVNEVRVFEDLLIIHPRGGEGVALMLDPARIASVEADPEVARGGLGNPGVPDIGREHAVAGRPPNDGIVFFNVRNPERAVKIMLKDEPYAGLVIEVEDPLATVTAIREAVGEA